MKTIRRLVSMLLVVMLIGSTVFVYAEEDNRGDAVVEATQSEECEAEGTDLSVAQSMALNQEQPLSMPENNEGITDTEIKYENSVEAEENAESFENIRDTLNEEEVSLPEDQVGADDTQDNADDTQDNADDTQDNADDTQDNADDTQDNADDTQDNADDTQDTADDDTEELYDPGFIVTDVLYLYEFGSEGQQELIRANATVNTSDGIYNGKEVENLYQTLTTDEQLFKSKGFGLEFKVADSERVKIFIDGEEKKSGEEVDFSSGELKIAAVVDEKETIEYTVTLDIENKLAISTNKDTLVYASGLHENISMTLHFYKRFKSVDSVFFLNRDIKPVTGMTVSLKNAKNIKISDSSDIGGSSSKTTLNSGEIAAITFIPTGEGEISGELIFSCDNREDTIIELTGKSEWYTEAGIVKNLVKYVVYSFIVGEEKDTAAFSIEGNLPEGMDFDPEKREIYGAPLKEGQYDFSVIRESNGEKTKVFYTMFVTVNEDFDVWNETHYDGFYGFTIPDNSEEIGKNIWAVSDFNQDTTFVSEGKYDYYVKVWLNGEVLKEGTDYTSESGSTRVTLLKQTLQNKCKKISQEDVNLENFDPDYANTLCVEFNIHPEKSVRGEEYLRRTSENFYIVDDGNKAEVTPTVTPIPITTPPVDSGYSTTVHAAVVDSSGNAMSGYTVELHSTVQTAVTDASGVARFSSIEMGAHSIYVKNSNGNVMASRNFTLIPGASTSYNGNQITVARGDTVNLTITVSTATSNSKTSATVTGTAKAKTTSVTSAAKASNAVTGDSNDIYLYIVLIALALYVLKKGLKKA